MISMVDISVCFTKVMLDLAGLYLMTEDLDSCQHQLMSLLKNEKENDAATIVSHDRAEIWCTKSGIERNFWWRLQVGEQVF